MNDKILCVCGALLIACGIFDTCDNNEISIGSAAKIALGIVEIMVAFI